MATTMSTQLETLLGDKAEHLLGFSSPKISKERLNLPGPDFMDRVFMQTDRNNRLMLILEITIVLLFVIDVLMLFRH